MGLRRVLVCSAIALAMVGTLAAAPAQAADNDGWWYSTDFTVDKAHGAGITGKGVTIALLDAPVDTSVAWLKGADITSLSNPVCAGINGENQVAGTTTDPRNARHSTAMVGLYAGNGKTASGGRAFLGVAPGAHIVTVPIGTTKEFVAADQIECNRPSNWGTVTLDPALGFKAGDVPFEEQGNYAIAAAINMAIDAGADIIHMPFLGYITKNGDIRPGDPLEAAMLRAMRKGIIVVTGRANEKGGLVAPSSAPADHTYFPGTLTVNSVDQSGHLASTSNVADPGTDILAPGVGIWKNPGGDPSNYATAFEVGNGGTSSASAIMCGYLALLKNEYPKATNNQILRLALASTYQGKGTMTRDPDNYFGWGMFTFAYTDTDPTTLPDTNPIYLYDIEDALAYEKKYIANTNGEDGPGAPDLPQSDWWTGADYSRSSGDIRNAWPREFALYNEMTGKKTTATNTPTATASTTNAAAITATSSGIPPWIWIIAGAIILAAAATAIALATRRRRAPSPTPPATAGWPGVSPTGYAPPGYIQPGAYTPPGGYVPPRGQPPTDTPPAQTPTRNGQ